MKKARYDSMQERIVANSVLAPNSYPLVHGERCWLWLGARRRSNRGLEYGAICMRAKSGPRKGKPITHTVTRIVVREFKDRRVTPKMVIRHLCNNTICVNPAHLIGGTQKQNVRDTVKAGRHRNGHT